MMALEVIAEHLGLTALIHGLGKLRRARFLRYRVIRPSVEIRIALSAIIRFQQGGKYILVHNLHRPESFAPFGGVYKYYEGTFQELETLTFRPQDLGPGGDMKNDLRGFIQRGKLHAFLSWFERGEGRESVHECLVRELKEEIGESGLSNKLKLPQRLEFRRVRRVEEGPETVSGLSCKQYRIFDVYEPGASPDGAAFVKKLFKIAPSYETVIVVDAAGILKGRANNGKAIAHHAGYLIGAKRIRPDSPPL